MCQFIDNLQNTIKQLCTEKNISINKLATLSGLTQSTIDSIMKGKSKNPKMETLRKIANGFGIEYDYFISCLYNTQDHLLLTDDPNPTASSDPLSTVILGRDGTRIPLSKEEEERIYKLLEVAMPDLFDDSE